MRIKAAKEVPDPGSLRRPQALKLCLALGGQAEERRTLVLFILDLADQPALKQLTGKLVHRLTGDRPQVGQTYGRRGPKLVKRDEQASHAGREPTRGMHPASRSLKPEIGQWHERENASLFFNVFHANDISSTWLTI